MCVLCYETPPEDHWSDGVSSGTTNEFPGSARYQRTKILSVILASHGLTVSYPGIGPHYVIADRKGATEVAAGLPAVWQTVDRLASREVDVLDPVLLAAIASGVGA